MRNSKAWLPIAALFAVGLLVSGCGGGGGGSTAAVPADPPAEDPADKQMALIASASAGLTTALAGLDEDEPTLAQMAAVDAAIALLGNALTGANDLSPNETAAARSQLDAAKMTVATARTTHKDALDLAARREVQKGDISDTQGELSDALEALMADDADSIDAVNDAITALQAAIDAADDLTDAETMAAQADADAAEVQAANAEIVMYGAAAMADSATNEAMLAAYEGKLKAAMRLKEAAAATAADRERASEIIGSANALIAQLKKDIQDAADEEENKMRLASNAEAMQVAKAVNAHKVGGDPPTEFDTSADGTNWSVTRTSGNAVIKLNQTESAATGKPYATKSAPSAGAGWTGTTFTYSDSSIKRPITEMASVYTDIEQAKNEKYLSFFATAGATAARPDADDSTGALSLVSGTNLKSGKPTGSIFPAVVPPTGTRTATGLANRPYAGTYYGVSGTFTCSAACTITVDDEGEVTSSADITFVPSGTDLTKVVVPGGKADMSYTTFGYWMESTTNRRTGVMTHEVQTFSDGMGDTAGDLSTIEGTATYFGAAAGVYVKKDGVGESHRVTNGAFTAEALLTATFGEPTGTDKLGDDAEDVITGTISNFMDDDGSDLGFAKLTLNSAPITLTGEGVGAITGGTTSGGAGTQAGEWSGQFYGNEGADTDTDATDDIPSDVSGQFNGHFVNGHVAGAFGAEKD